MKRPYEELSCRREAPVPVVALCYSLAAVARPVRGYLSFAVPGKVGLASLTAFFAAVSTDASLTDGSLLLSNTTCLQTAQHVHPTSQLTTA